MASSFGATLEQLPEVFDIDYERAMGTHRNAEETSFRVAALDSILTDEPKHQPHLRQLLDSPDALKEPWKPTSTTKGPWEHPGTISPSIIRKKGLFLDHRDVRLNPYLPQAWINRGYTFLGFGYGELAVADAYRARLLVEAFLGGEKDLFKELDSESAGKPTLARKVLDAVASRCIPSLKDKGLPQFHAAIKAVFKGLEEKVFSMMVESLISIEASYDAREVAHEAKRRFPEHGFFAFMVRALETRAVRKKGKLHRVQYPWIAPEELGRGKRAIKKIKAVIEAESDNAVLQSSPLCCGTEGSLGVFARRDIQMGEQILLGKSIYETVNDYIVKACDACCGPLRGTPLTLDCCKARYCKPSCKMEAIKSYHRILCGKGFGWLHQAYSNADPFGNDMVPLLMVKVLATAIQQNAKPLKMACVGTMQVGYGKGTRSCFKLFDNVIAPVEVLQSLGVDIFTDRRFDSWAMQTLFLRIENNRHGVKFRNKTYSGLDPMFTMLNHDCGPAAVWHPKTGTVGSSIVVSACRDIKVGEEICISYTLVHLPEVERREMVKQHIGRVCECARCLNERAAAAAGRQADIFDLTGIMEVTARIMLEQQKLEQ